MATLCGCGGSTGGYPPPPPPYQAPPAALAAAKDSKFQPLVRALVAQRNAAKALADYSASGTGDQAKYQEMFGASRAAAKAVGEAVAKAGLSAEERAIWDSITSLDDAQLAALVS